MLKGFQ